MATPVDFTTRARSEMFSAFQAYQALQRRVQDLQDEVTALGGDWAALATKLGVSVGDAEAVYNLWGSATTEINAAFLTQLQGRLG